MGSQVRFFCLFFGVFFGFFFFFGFGFVLTRKKYCLTLNSLNIPMTEIAKCISHLFFSSSKRFPVS